MRIEKDGNIKNSNFKVQQFNNNVDKRSFVIDRLFFGNYETGDDETKNLYENNPIDLVDCNVSILLTNTDDKINEGANLYITNLNGDTPTTKDDKISINWLLDRNITNYSGKRSFQLVFSKNNGDIVLRTKVMSFNVLSSLDTEENIIEVAPSLIQEWENKLNTVLNQSNDFNTYADNKINEKIENKMYFYKESMQEITTSIENENNFPITMQNYNKDNCITQINVNGIRNTAYTINELNEVVFNTPIKVIGTKIQIFILKAIVSDSIDLNALKGDKGDKGEGIPTGGTTGQVLSKKSNTNYDYEWTNNEATVEVIDNLTSTDTTKPLSANQGRLLNQKLNYYIEETVIGTWIDGKPIYRKVIECGNLPNNTSKTVSCNIGANIVDQMIKQSFIWYDTVDKAWRNDSRWDSTSIHIEYHYKSSNDVIWINSLGTDWSGRTTKACVILEYTKTTDS